MFDSVPCLDPLWSYIREVLQNKRMQLERGSKYKITFCFSRISIVFLYGSCAVIAEQVVWLHMRDTRGNRFAEWLPIIVISAQLFKTSPSDIRTLVF